MTLDWLGDDGPLVLLAEAHAAGWEGIWRDATAGDPEEEIEELGGRRVLMDATLDGERTDYARACALLAPSVLAALVPYRGGVALALETPGTRPRSSRGAAAWSQRSGSTPRARRTPRPCSRA